MPAFAGASVAAEKRLESSSGPNRVNVLPEPVWPYAKLHEGTVTVQRRFAYSQ
jgi:hypothetical protein